MKIAVFTDLHANLPALKAFIQHIEGQRYDQIIHLGDAIAIGPHPRECLDLLMDMHNIRFVRGNHDDWYVNGLPQPQPKWMTNEELFHQEWTHKQLGNKYLSIVRDWPWIISQSIHGVNMIFLHYALNEDGRSYKPFIPNPSVEDFDDLFDIDVDFVFYGHTHIKSSLQGRAWYLTPGSAGCQTKSYLPYLDLTIEDGNLDVQYQIIKYDDRTLFEDFETREVPAREFIYKAFFGSRSVMTKGDEV